MFFGRICSEKVVMDIDVVILSGFRIGRFKVEDSLGDEVTLEWVISLLFEM